MEEVFEFKEIDIKNSKDTEKEMSFEEIEFKEIESSDI